MEDTADHPLLSLSDDGQASVGSPSSSSSASLSPPPPSPPTVSRASRYDDDEGNVCRICRNPGDDDNPLRYPCACSGSIKFVHQDCLLQWLNHINARQCELLKQALEASGNDLDSSIKSLNELRLDSSYMSLVLAVGKLENGIEMNGPLSSKD